uniref:Tergamotene synthase n=1 Tax=Santalum album TaxID=35974 RepID=A0A678Y186_SANAL|nr:tergamotene synthase [Santalum album]
MDSATLKVLCDNDANVKIEKNPSGNRRSANYEPSIWNYDFLQSLDSCYNIVEEKHLKLAEKLKGEVKSIIKAPMEPLAKLELVDVVQRLGLKHLFETEIKEALFTVYKDGSDAWWLGHLYATSLRFRLLRQAGLFIPQDVFEIFKSATGEFDMKLRDNIEGLLSLYEASFLGWKGENILDEAKAFTTEYLKNAWENIPQKWLAIRVKHALDLPLHWRVPRFEARWFIDAYEREENINPTLLKLAKLDFNMVQSIHQRELGKLARWWVSTGLDKLSFARNNLMQSYMYGTAVTSDPQFKLARETIVKTGSLITIVDDVYDVFGSIDELELYTNFVDRWNCTEVDELPNTIKMIFLAMFNTANEIGFQIQTERGFNGIPALSKAWDDLCKSYIKEAKWYHGKHKPTLQEYLGNAVVSVGFPLLMTTGYVAIADSEGALDKIDRIPDLVRYACLLNRLVNDLATSSDELARGDTLKSIECYMNQTGASEEIAREHIKGLIEDTWKTLNECSFDDSQFGEPFVSFNLNSVRGSHFFYQHGDGYGVTNSWTKDDLMSILINPISVDDES